MAGEASRSSPERPRDDSTEYHDQVDEPADDEPDRGNEEQRHLDHEGSDPVGSPSCPPSKAEPGWHEEDAARVREVT